MAREIAVRIKGRKDPSNNQAIFVNDDDLTKKLTDIREIIDRQSIKAPLEYRFLSSNGNVIPLAMEDTLSFVQITNLTAVQSEDGEESASIVSEFWVTATPFTENDGADASPSNSAHSTNNNDDDQNNTAPRPQMADVPPPVHSNFCPWKAFVKVVHDRNNSTNLMKLLFVLLAVLFALLASLILTTHLTFWTFTSLTSTPEFASLIAKFKSAGPASCGEDLSGLRLKLSELEMNHKYQLEQLSGKLTELEDLYLNDLAVHKREMASLKSRQMDLQGSFASQSDFVTLSKRVDHLIEHASATSTYTKESDAGINPAEKKEKKKGKKEKLKEGA